MIAPANDLNKKIYNARGPETMKGYKLKLLISSHNNVPCPL
jgi:hypothetical protein